ncbi:MAG: 50S ribosomal protein L29 [Nitrospinota bacterium]
MKAAEFRELTDEELSLKLEELRKEYLNNRFQLTTQQLENQAKVRFVRRDIARILTTMNQRKKSKDVEKSR